MLINAIRNFITDSGYASSPDFIVVGAQKAGTTALFAILKQHSQLTGALKKELHFFDDENSYSEKNYRLYHRNFPLPYNVQKNNLLFEITPSYLYHPEAAERIFKYKPGMKIIISLRNPSYRALSAWNMYHHYGKDNKTYSHLYDKRSFKEAIYSELEKIDTVTRLNDKISYVKRGVYYPQVKTYLDIFPKKNILIIEHEELKNNHDQTIKKITDFLEITYETLKPLEVLKSEHDNESLYMNELMLLDQFYKPHNHLLYELLGTNYNWQINIR